MHPSWKNSMLQSIQEKLPLVRDWIDKTLVEHAGKACPVMEYKFSRLPQFFNPQILSVAKVVVVDHLPVPPLTSMGLDGFWGFEHGNYAGITYKDTYFIHPSEAGNESLHFHELVHVVQWKVLGVEKFLRHYAFGILTCGYHDSPLEEMARDLQANFDKGIAPFDVVYVLTKMLEHLPEIKDKYPAPGIVDSKE